MLSLGPSPRLLHSPPDAAVLYKDQRGLAAGADGLFQRPGGDIQAAHRAALGRPMGYRKMRVWKLT
jgi:hypothetical protein